MSVRVAQLCFVAAIVGCALFSWSTARAAASSRLVYGRGPGTENCPNEAVFRQAVVARVGYDPFFPWAELTVVATSLSFFAHGEALATVAGAIVRVDGRELWRSPLASVSIGGGGVVHF